MGYDPGKRYVPKMKLKPDNNIKLGLENNTDEDLPLKKKLIPLKLASKKIDKRRSDAPAKQGKKKGHRFMDDDDDSS